MTDSKEERGTRPHEDKEWKTLGEHMVHVEKLRQYRDNYIKMSYDEKMDTIMECCGCFYGEWCDRCCGEKQINYCGRCEGYTLRNYFRLR